MICYELTLKWFDNPSCRITQQIDTEIWADNLVDLSEKLFSYLIENHLRQPDHITIAPF